MFWLLLILFILASVGLTAVVLLQEPKQSGLGEGLAGGGSEFSTSGGTAGNLQRITIYVAVTWAVLALLLQIVPR